jgi:hypothetical protein
LKNADRPFPANQEVGVLKWRYTSTDSKEIPLTSKNEKEGFYSKIEKFILVNCWPNETANGGCDVNIEYELQNTNLVLKDVQISVPLP